MDTTVVGCNRFGDSLIGLDTARHLPFDRVDQLIDSASGRPQPATKFLAAERRGLKRSSRVEGTAGDEPVAKWTSDMSATSVPFANG
jgi:hypothetical protein